MRAGPFDLFSGYTGCLGILVGAQLDVVQLDLVGLLQLESVQSCLLIILAARVLQGLSHLEVIFLLPAAVYLHEAPPTPIGFSHLLLKHTLAENQLFLQALAVVLQVHEHQRLLLQLLLGHSVAILCLYQLLSKLGLCIQTMVFTEGYSQLSLMTMKQGFQVLPSALGHRELSYPLLGTLPGLL